LAPSRVVLLLRHPQRPRTLELATERRSMEPAGTTLRSTSSRRTTRRAMRDGRCRIAAGSRRGRRIRREVGRRSRSRRGRGRSGGRHHRRLRLDSDAARGRGGDHLLRFTDAALDCVTGQECCLGGYLVDSGTFAGQQCAASGATCSNGVFGSDAAAPPIPITCSQIADSRRTASPTPSPAACRERLLPPTRDVHLSEGDAGHRGRVRIERRRATAPLRARPARCRSARRRPTAQRVRRARRASGRSSSRLLPLGDLRESYPDHAAERLHPCVRGGRGGGIDEGLRAAGVGVSAREARGSCEDGSSTKAPAVPTRTA